jgi:GxxExxY protein
MRNLDPNPFEPRRRRERGGSAEELNRLSEAILGAAILVHRTLGPGLLESVYETCLAHELNRRNLSFHRQIPMPVQYGGLRIDNGYRIDLLVENRLVVEVKAVQKTLPVHEAQLLTYLRLSECSLGLLLNFNVPVLKDGITRLVNGFPDLCETSASSASRR